jgi:hypothetical protein
MAVVLVSRSLQDTNLLCNSTPISKASSYIDAEYLANTRQDPQCACVFQLAQMKPPHPELLLLSPSCVI